MDDLRLNHIGFVVASIQSAVPGFLRTVSTAWNEKIFEDPNQQAKVTFLVRLGEPQIELVEPLDARSPINKFLLQKGGGLHHLCYETKDLELTLRLIRARGAMLVKRPLPAVAFEGRRIAWVLTKENLLVEFLES